MKPQEIYIKMTITDIAELRYMQHTLLENLNLLSQLDDDCTTNRSVKDSVYWISKILQSIHQE
ncbi:hypothetical protein ABW636_11540 [Aquimarina sp. 2201CG1-2-11]|uniref:hypothetical protein n=1 Tax=Aquimarina discodermiae TaxID=3231043 RepID=UPI0034627ABF